MIFLCVFNEFNETSPKYFYFNFYFNYYRISSDQQFICSGLIQANESIWNQFLQKADETSSNDLLLLGCSENFNIIEKHLNSFEGSYRYDYLFQNMLKNLLNDAAINFFIKKFDEMVTE